MEKDEVYTKERVYEILKNSENNTIFKIAWKTRNTGNTGNGRPLDARVIFDGFDEGKKPRLVQEGGTLLDIERLDDGYNSIKLFEKVSRMPY
jgi:hypothetical protein